MQHLDEGRLQEWIDRERSGLSPDEVDDIKRHLASCAECAARLSELTNEDVLARSLLSAGAPAVAVPDFASIGARAESLATGRRRHRTIRRGAWAASVAVALGVGWAANEMSRPGTLASLDASSGAVSVPASEDAVAEVAAAPQQAAEAEVAATPQQAAEAEISEAPPQVALADVPSASLDNATAANVVADRTVPLKVGASTAGAAAERTAPAPTVPESPPATVSARVTSDLAAIGRSASAPARVVSGRITDTSGAPLDAVQVFIEGTTIGTLTNGRGEYRLEVNEGQRPAGDGPLTLTAQRIGYGQVSRSLPGASGAMTDLDMSLTAEALALDQIVVTGSGGGARQERAADSFQAARRGADVAREGVTADALRDDATVDHVLVDGVTWTPREPVDAETLAGFIILALPDLPVDEAAAESVGGGWVTRIVQTLEDGGRVVLLQSRRPIRVDDDPLVSNGEVATTSRGDFFLTAMAEMPRESLEAVLRQVR